MQNTLLVRFDQQIVPHSASALALWLRRSVSMLSLAAMITVIVACGEKKAVTSVEANGHHRRFKVCDEIGNVLPGATALYWDSLRGLVRADPETAWKDLVLKPNASYLPLTPEDTQGKALIAIAAPGYVTSVIPTPITWDLFQKYTMLEYDCTVRLCPQKIVLSVAFVDDKGNLVPGNIVLLDWWSLPVIDLRSSVAKFALNRYAMMDKWPPPMFDFVREWESCVPIAAAADGYCELRDVPVWAEYVLFIPHDRTKYSFGMVMVDMLLERPGLRIVVQRGASIRIKLPSDLPDGSNRIITCNIAALTPTVFEREGAKFTVRFVSDLPIPTDMKSDDEITIAGVPFGKLSMKLEFDGKEWSGHGTVINESGVDIVLSDG